MFCSSQIFFALWWETSSFRGRDHSMEKEARDALHALGFRKLARLVRVEWQPRLRSTAGRADYRKALVSLNPVLRKHGGSEIDRTLRHELAHLIAHERAAGQRILSHGREWRRACRELGIEGERACHNLPLAVTRRSRRYLYKCPVCESLFPRVNVIRRAIACLACCRRNSRGQFDARFRLRLVRKCE